MGRGSQAHEYAFGQQSDEKRPVEPRYGPCELNVKVVLGGGTVLGPSGRFLVVERLHLHRNQTEDGQALSVLHVDQQQRGVVLPYMSPSP